MYFVNVLLILVLIVFKYIVKIRRKIYILFVKREIYCMATRALFLIYTYIIRMKTIKTSARTITYFSTQ